MRQIIEKVIKNQDISQTEAKEAMQIIMKGEATAAQIATYITALRMKGETIDEITGSAQAMRAAAVTIKVNGSPVDVKLNNNVQAMETIVDTCGTGGDSTNTFNISTVVALVVAGAGLTVAKHGNRSVSSKSGSADVLEACGVNIGLNPLQVQKCIEEVGIGFLFAPNFHPAMKYAVGPRREIGIRTIFNILGPLCNPANANVQILGVYDESLTETLATVLGRLGVTRALVVHGEGGLDEISLLGKTTASQVINNGKSVKTFTITPEEAGLERVELKDLQGGSAEDNAKIIRGILAGEKGAKADVVLLNAGAALWVAGLASSIKEGVDMAASSINQGQAKQKLDQLIEVSNKLSLSA